jgi:ribosomal protein S18 acetylase RimI-like enzyme
MSLYGDYIKERENFQIVENDKGFMTFVIENDYCYIRDIYVSPEYRRQKVGLELLNQIIEIAKQHEIKVLTGSVCTAVNHVEESLTVLLHNGFKLINLDGNMIYFKKEI